MTTTIQVKDGTGAAQQLVVQIDGNGNLTPAHIEDQTQRSALISQFAPLATAAGQATSASTIVTALQAQTAATQPVSLASLPLPSGAALDTSVQGVITKLGTTLAVSASSLPLPSGAALDASVQAVKTALQGTLAVSGPLTAGQLTTAALATAAAQATGNTSLASLVTNTTGLALAVQLPASLGAKASAASLPVTLASDGVYATMTTAGNASLATIATNTASNATVANQVTGNTALQAIQNSVAGRLLVDTVVQAVAANRSGTITAGGTAQTIMAANTSRRGFVIQNNSTGPLYVNGLGAATSDGLSLVIAAGAYYETSVQHTGTGAVSILGATTGQAFYSREF